MNSPRLPKLSFNGRRKCKVQDNLNLEPELRQRCHSETRNSTERERISEEKRLGMELPASPISIPPRTPSMSYSRRRTMHATRIFTLDSSITKSKDQLARLCQELHTVNEDLSHVMKMKRQMSSDTQSTVSGNSSSGNSSSDDNDDDFYVNGDMLDLCRTAQHDLRMADLAKVELQTMLAEVEAACRLEEKDMVCRAGWLRRESAHFEKLSPMAVEKLNPRSRRESHPPSAGTEMPELSLRCLSL